MQSLKNKNQKGIAALFTVILIGAITFLEVYSTALIGLGELDMGLSAAGGAKALGVAHGCMEETYRHIRIDPLYGITLGPMSFTAPDGSCIIEVVSAFGIGRVITVTGTSGSYNKKIQAAVILSGALYNVISIVSWSEQSN